MSFINALLQGKVKRAFRAVDRFAINSTYGFLGTTDRAAELGLERQEEDFGQTLAVWGVPSGPFIMLPLLGPSTLRDAAGFGVDSVTDPWTDFQQGPMGLSSTETLGVTAFEVVELRARLLTTADPLIANALDPYATVKSAYLQSRLVEINDGAAPVSQDGAFEETEEFEPFDDFTGDGGGVDAPPAADDDPGAFGDMEEFEPDEAPFEETPPGDGTVSEPEPEAAGGGR